MEYLSANEIALKWGISSTMVRRYCTRGQIPDAFFEYGIWKIPEDAKKPGTPVRAHTEEGETPPLLKKLLRQQHSYHSYLYDYLQINFSYSSSRMASNRLTRNHVEYLFKKSKLLFTNEDMKLNDFIEMRNHFLCVDYVIANATKSLKSAFPLKLHSLLFSDVCGHKMAPIRSGAFRSGPATLEPGLKVPPATISEKLTALFKRYECIPNVTFQDILDLHVQFERIRPFDDGNGRVGRLLMLKECLRHDITPIIIDDKHRADYLDGIRLWSKDRSILAATCITAQARFHAQMELGSLLEEHDRVTRV